MRIDYTDSQLYFDIILHVQNVCKDKCAVCAKYTVHCKVYSVYIAYIYAHCAIYIFIYLEIAYLPSQNQRILRALVK